MFKGLFAVGTILTLVIYYASKKASVVLEAKKQQGGY